MPALGPCRGAPGSGGRVTPQVSVVVGVRDGGDQLLASLKSILQQDVDLELLVVDDGSKDQTGELLRSLVERDARVRVYRQERIGLTAALRLGCSKARGAYIARQDCGDVSHPGRLKAQLAVMAEPDTVLASCWAEALGPAGEFLYAITRPRDPAAATRALREEQLGLPHHGTALFRRECYERVGGYRTAFPVAQDWDLWLRLTELGPLSYAPEVLYAFEIGLRSVSALRRAEQTRYVDLARRCAFARARSGSDEAALAAPSAPMPSASSSSNAYFIGKCLLDRRDRRALRYLRMAVRERPIRARAWLALAWAAAVCRERPTRP